MFNELFPSTNDKHNLKRLEEFMSSSVDELSQHFQSLYQMKPEPLSISEDCLVLFEEEILKSQDKYLISTQCNIEAMLKDDDKSFTPQFKQFMRWCSDHHGCKTYGDVLKVDVMVLFGKSEEFGLIKTNKYIQKRLSNLKNKL